MKENDFDSFVVSTLDDVCWLLNIRGDDVQYNPYVYSYVVIDKEKVHLFIHENRIPSDCPHFSNVDIEFHKYEEFFHFLGGMKGSVGYDENKISYAIYDQLKKFNVKSIME